MITITGSHVNNNARLDGGPKPLMIDNMVATLTKQTSEGNYKLEIRDKANVEFYLDILIDEKDLE